MSASYGPVKPYKPGPISQKVSGLLDYFGVGHYPKEYNPRVHGPYDPSRFYGKKGELSILNDYLRSNLIDFRFSL